MTGTASWAIADARAQWRSDIEALAPDAGPSLWDAQGQLIIRSWTEPHRVYHSLRHVAEMLAALKRLAKNDPGLHPQARAIAHLATWYHDVAYDPRATPGSNEQRSATVARDHLHRLGVQVANIDAVERLILMTTDHSEGPHGALQAPLLDAFHDADLWILSAPTHRYGEYARQVREEYAHVPQDLFAAGRSHILHGFTDRPQIYRTSYARRAWEDSARANVAAEITRLT